MIITNRIAELRSLMEKEGVDAYLVPSTDPHNSEYVPECWKRRPIISGFTGSAGDVVITKDEAGMWTDGRYFLQAEQQLEGTGITLFRILEPNVPKIEEWLAEKLTDGGVLGVDPQVLSMGVGQRIERALSRTGASVKYLDRNLVDAIWPDQPARASTPLEIMPDEISGSRIGEKLTAVRKLMAEAECSVHFVGALDAIAWLFNLRGSDIAYSKMFISYAVITEESAHLFIDTDRVTDEVKEHLGDSVEVHPYEDVSDFVKAQAALEGSWWVDPAYTNQWIHLVLESAQLKLHEARSPIEDLKAVKNPTEQAGFKDCLKIDGVAMVRFLKWLETAVPEGGVTEISAAEKLREFRALDPSFICPSFATIAGYGEHGAIIHYEATPETNAEIRPESLLLLDSGGHYTNGTTDITRTLPMGPPTEEQKEAYTQVLKGLIGLSTLKFPNGYSGKQLELAARRPLWEGGRNFNHGTGHGVGHSLNVHEGPMRFSPKSDVPIGAGNVLTIEPGHYEEGEYAIRIENLVICHEDESSERHEKNGFLSFETITLCPIDLDLIERNLLTQDEINWLNAYHKDVFDQLSGNLDEEHRKWLRSKTREI